MEGFFPISNKVDTLKFCSIVFPELLKEKLMWKEFATCATIGLVFLAIATVLGLGAIKIWPMTGFVIWFTIIFLWGSALACLGMSMWLFFFGWKNN